jgi:carbonic anhydrase
MDARLHVEELLGLEQGDAHVIRNAGGLITDDAMRSLAISQRRLGTSEVMLIHHTDCGMLGFDEEGFRRELREEAGSEPDWDSGGFADLDDDVRRSVELVRSSPFIPHTDRVRGFVYDVDSGELREVQ